MHQVILIKKFLRVETEVLVKRVKNVAIFRLELKLLLLAKKQLVLEISEAILETF